MFSGYGSLDTAFAICAIIGGVLFLLRLILMLVGSEHGDAGVDIDHGGGLDAHDLGDSDAAFSLLSLQGLTAFLMVFGLIGLGIHRQFEQSGTIATLGAVVAGVAAMWIMAKLFQFMAGLQTSGTVDMNNAVGEEGTIYLTIPEKGTGKAQISIQEHHKVLDAVSDGTGEIKTGERIRVVRVVSGNILVVEKL